MMIEATMSGADAGRISWDATVVGAGPAGAVLARQLARDGLKVLLVDRQNFPRSKVCGGCLSAATLSALDGLGLGDVPAALGAAELRRFQLAGWGRSVSLPLPAGASLSRTALDAELVRRAVAEGVDFLPGFAATLGDTTDSERRLELNGPGGRIEVGAAVVAAADGLASGLFRDDAGAVDSRPSRRRRIGASMVVDADDAPYRNGTIYMAVGREGYVGLVRLEDGRLNVAAAFDPAALRQGCAGVVAAAVLAEAGFPPVSGLDVAAWRGTKPLRVRPRRTAGERLFAVGDAAGYVEPFTGEGIGWAIGSAALLAPLMAAAAARWRPEMAARWSRLHAAEIGGSQHLCSALSGALRHPRAVRLALSLLSWQPGLGAPFVRRLAGDAAPLPLGGA